VLCEAAVSGGLVLRAAKTGGGLAIRAEISIPCRKSESKDFTGRQGNESFEGDQREGCAMMSLPFLLFACAIGAAWLRHRGVAMGFWVIGLVAMLVLFRFHATEVLNIGL
jgi:hypothetical protein